MDKEAVSKPPYALVLLPTIELCHQIASVFQSLTDDSMLPCTVHKDSKLQINSKHPVILATPSVLSTYSPRTLSNIRVVVTDEADFLLTNGQQEIYEILSYFMGVDITTKRRKKQRLRPEQFISDAEVHDKDSNGHKFVRNVHSPGEASGFHASTTALALQRQFIFVAATLPSRGEKDICNVLREWLPDAELISSDLAHHTVPTVDICYIKVEDALKLPELLRCLNSLVGLIRYPLSTIGRGSNKDATSMQEANVDHSTNYSSGKREDEKSYSGERVAEGLDLGKETIDGESQRRQGEACVETVGMKNLRVLVFVNTTKAAEEAYNFLSGTAEQGESDSVPWKHVILNDQTTTIWQNDPGELDRDAGAKAQRRVVTHTGYIDLWPGKVGQIHKNILPAERIDTLKKFTSGELKVLICTDLASRGLDIPDVSHVIQLDFALSATQVLHRTGRTARAGASGKVINFVAEHDQDLARAIRACHQSQSNDGYQATFSRKRSFRKKLKKNAIALADKL